MRRSSPSVPHRAEAAAVPESERTHRAGLRLPARHLLGMTSWLAALFPARRSRRRSRRRVTMLGAMTLTRTRRADSKSVTRAQPSLAIGLRVFAALGRWFTRRRRHRAARRGAVARTWVRRSGRSRHRRRFDYAGRRAAEVIGVMPARFSFPDTKSESDGCRIDDEPRVDSLQPHGLWRACAKAPRSKAPVTRSPPHSRIFASAFRTRAGLGVSSP
jgi:hypothetical protein